MNNNNNLVRVCPFCESEYQAKSVLHEEGLCGNCEISESLSQEFRRLRGQAHRAKEAGVSTTLTLKEWLATLGYFGYVCAYCQGPYEVLDHFISIRLGGGTTNTNCVPACGSCNVSKEKSGLPEKWLERAASFLKVQTDGSDREVMAIDNAMRWMIDRREPREESRVHYIQSVRKPEKIIIPRKKGEHRSTNTDRLWDTTRDKCKELADKWDQSKVFVYDVAIQFAALFDSPEELAAQVAIPKLLPALKGLLGLVYDTIATAKDLHEVHMAEQALAEALGQEESNE